MKALLITFLMVLVLIMLWFGFSVYTEDTSAVLVSSMDKIYNNVLDMRWVDATDDCNQFLKQWEHCSRFYGLYLDNVCVHDIELSAHRCMGYIKSENASLAAGEAASILSHLQLLKEADRIQMFNLM